MSEDDEGNEITTIQINATTVKKQIPIIGEVYTDRSKVADSFAKVQLGLRIMPSQNDEAGLWLM